jgi:putative toxin-antitoxin system antitoxin component (TIGR02293 family)
MEANVLVLASEYYEMPRAQFVKIMGMSPATAERKIKNRSLLGPIESERLERLAIIEELAENVFGNEEKAKHWLMRTNLALGDTPLSMMDTETGAGEVRKVLASIAYGGAV